MKIIREVFKGKIFAKPENSETFDSRTAMKIDEHHSVFGPAELFQVLMTKEPHFWLLGGSCRWGYTAGLGALKIIQSQSGFYCSMKTAHVIA